MEENVCVREVDPSQTSGRERQSEPLGGRECA